MAESIVSIASKPTKSPTLIDRVRKSDAKPGHTVITVYRPHSDVVDERLDEQYRRVMEVAGNIEAAKEAWSRSGLVSGVEVGKQVEATEAAKKMHSLLKVAAEALIEIASRIAPPAIWQYGEDSILEHYCAVEVAAKASELP